VFTKVWECGGVQEIFSNLDSALQEISGSSPLVSGPGDRVFSIRDQFLRINLDQKGGVARISVLLGEDPAKLQEQNLDLADCFPFALTDLVGSEKIGLSVTFDEQDRLKIRIAKNTPGTVYDCWVKLQTKELSMAHENHIHRLAGDFIELKGPFLSCGV
jgi:hypothetical protein